MVFISFGTPRKYQLVIWPKKADGKKAARKPSQLVGKATRKSTTLLATHTEEES